MFWVGRTRSVKVDYREKVANLSSSETDDPADGGIVFGLVSGRGVEHAKKNGA